MQSSSKKTRMATVSYVVESRSLHDAYASDWDYDTLGVFASIDDAEEFVRSYLDHEYDDPADVFEEIVYGKDDGGRVTLEATDQEGGQLYLGIKVVRPRGAKKRAA